jgi:hypothetical protein
MAICTLARAPKFVLGLMAFLLDLQAAHPVTIVRTEEYELCYIT